MLRIDNLLFGMFVEGCVVLLSMLEEWPFSHISNYYWKWWNDQQISCVAEHNHNIVVPGKYSILLIIYFTFIIHYIGLIWGLSAGIIVHASWIVRAAVKSDGCGIYCGLIACCREKCWYSYGDIIFVNVVMWLWVATSLELDSQQQLAHIVLFHVRVGCINPVSVKLRPLWSFI
jgi:hypothetical protein